MFFYIFCYHVGTNGLRTKFFVGSVERKKVGGSGEKVSLLTILYFTNEFSIPYVCVVWSIVYINSFIIMVQRLEAHNGPPIDLHSCCKGE